MRKIFVFALIQMLSFCALVPVANGKFCAAMDETFLASESPSDRLARDHKKATSGAYRIATDVSDLRTFSGTSNEVITLLGYYNEGDGGGQDLYWDSTSTEAENSGTIFQTTSMPTGRWKSVSTSFLNVKQFGVFTNQTTQMQAAINFASATGTALYLDSTSYTFGTLILKSNLNIVGNNCIINNTANTSIFYTSKPIAHMSIKDIYFNGTYSSNNACIHVDSSLVSNATISGCSFTGSRRGIDMDIVSNLQVSDCYFYNMQNNAMYIGYSTAFARSNNIICTNLRIKGVGSNQGNGLTFAYADKVTLANISIVDCGSNSGGTNQFHGIYFRSATEVTGNNIEVRNQKRGAGVHAFTSVANGEVRSVNYTFRNLRIVNTLNYTGIRLSQVDHIALEFCSIDSSSTNGIHADSLKGLIIRNSIVKNSNQVHSSGALAHSAIRLGTVSEVAIQGSELLQEATSQTHFQGNGVYLEGTASNVLLEENIFTVMPTAGGWFFLTTANSASVTGLILDKNRQTGASGFINQNTATLAEVEVTSNTIKNVTGSTFLTNDLLRSTFSYNNYYKTGIYPISSQNGRLELQASAAPTTNTWVVGDITYATSPAAGGNIGWVCTTAGTPGTWKSFGSISN